MSKISCLVAMILGFCACGMDIDVEVNVYMGENEGGSDAGVAANSKVDAAIAFDAGNSDDGAVDNADGASTDPAVDAGGIDTTGSDAGGTGEDFPVMIVLAVNTPSGSSVSSSQQFVIMYSLVAVCDGTAEQCHSLLEREVGAKKFVLNSTCPLEGKLGQVYSVSPTLVGVGQTAQVQGLGGNNYTIEFFEDFSFDGLKKFYLALDVMSCASGDTLTVSLAGVYSPNGEELAAPSASRTLLF